MKILKLSLALLIGFTVLNWHPSGAAAQDDGVAAAKKEGQLVLYLSTNLTDANGMVQLFKQKYPFINVNLFRADNEKLLNRILTESTAGKFNGDAIMISSFEVRVLLQKKLLQKYVSPHSQAYPEGFTDKDGFWTSVYSIPRVIAYNTNLVKPDVAPKTFDDVLNPRWKGGFGLSDSATLWYTGFLKFAGEEKGRDFMRKLAAQKPAFRDSETVIMQLLGAGEFPIGSGLLPPGGDDEETRRAGGMGTHGPTDRHRAETDRAQRQSAAPERRQTIYRLGVVERRSGTDPQLQPHPRPRRCHFGIKRRNQALPRRPALGRQLCEICGRVPRDLF